MFETHATAIRDYARTSPEATYHVIAFAVATANCPFQASVNTIKILREWNGDIMGKTYADVTPAEKSLMGCGMTGMKLTAYQKLWSMREEIYSVYRDCMLDPELGHITFWNYAMDALMGMGMVKAAFATQMLFNRLGCIDIHNARELGFTSCPSGKAKKQRPVYLNMQNVKTSRQWWDDWCNALAAKYPGQFTDGEQVSMLHALAVTGWAV
jgi:hypothetical protein